MGRTAFLSLMGMYNLEPTLFDGMNYPEEWTDQDKEHFKFELLTETAELEVIYNNGPVMRSMIAHWSAHRKPVWDHLIETTQYDYDPIANWDKRETTTETRNLSHTHSQTTSHSNTTTLGHKTDDNHTTEIADETKHSGTDTTNETTTGTKTGTTTGTVTHKVNGLGNNAADNGMAVKDSNETSETANDTTNETRNGSTLYGHKIMETVRNETSGYVQLSGSDTQSGNATSGGTDGDTGTITHEYVGQGNIGTMTSQDMIKQERDIAQFDIMEYIINDFKNRFLLLIY